MESESFIMPIHVYLKGWGFFYNTMEMEDPDELKMFSDQMVKWFVDNYPRLERPMEFKREDAEREARINGMKSFLDAITSATDPNADPNDPNQQQNP